MFHARMKDSQAEQSVRGSGPVNEKSGLIRGAGSAFPGRSCEVQVLRLVGQSQGPWRLCSGKPEPARLLQWAEED